MWVSPLLALRDSCLLLIGLSLCIAYVEAQTSTRSSTPSSSTPSLLSQHFIHPAKNDVLVPGGNFTIRWTVIAQFSFVTIQLWDKTSYGYSHDLLTPCSPYSRNSFCGTIANHAANTGSFEWRIPSPVNNTNNAGYPFPRGEKVFWIKIFVEDYMQSSIGNKDPVSSYSQNFAFAKEGETGTLVSVNTATMTVTGGWPLDTAIWTSISWESSSVGKTETGKAGTATVAVATRMPARNGSAHGAVEGKASRSRGNCLVLVLVLLGLV